MLTYKNIIFLLIVLISGIVFNKFIEDSLYTEIIIKTSDLDHREIILLSSDFDENGSIIFYNIDDKTNSIYLKYKSEFDEGSYKKIKYLLRKWNVEISNIEMINFYKRKS